MGTSRERLNQTLNHIEPDEIVVDLGSTAVTGISVEALAKLRDALGLDPSRIKIHEPLQLLGMVEEDVRQRLHLDCVDVAGISTIFGFSTEGRKPWVTQSGLEVDVPEAFYTSIDEKGRTYLYPQGDTSVPPCAVMPQGGCFFDNITRGNIELEEDLTSAREDFKDDYGILSDDQIEKIAKRCENYYKNTDYGLVYSSNLAALGDFAIIPGPNVKYPKGLRDLPDFMMAHSICPEYIHEVLDMHLEAGLENAKRIFKACGNKIQVMCVSGTDFGTQNGPYMSLDVFREFYKPRYQKINDWIHKNTTWKTFFHSCGAVSGFFQDFHECGVDIINPVQLSAQGMNGKELKEKWGDKFVFWGGGVDTQRTLPFGSPEDVYREVSERLELFSRGGGYVFNAIHNIQSQTSAENLIAMFQAVEDFNKKHKN